VLRWKETCHSSVEKIIGLSIVHGRKKIRTLVLSQQ
jgi:hypothetical protein